MRRLFNQLQTSSRPAMMRAPWPGAVAFKSTSTSNHFAPRCALAGDLLLSVATKVGKSALTGGSCSRCWSEGLGVWCQASGFDCGSSCPCGVFVFGSRVMKRFRLRSLSERGLSRSCRTDRPGMLKWVPDSAISDGCWPASARSFFSAGKDDELCKTLHLAHRPPNWNPLQHPPKHATPPTRHDPAPITIEAGIPHRPGAKAEHDERTRRSPASTVIKHLTPAPSNRSATLCRL